MIETAENTAVTESATSVDPITNEEVLELIIERIRLLARVRMAWLKKIWKEAGDEGNYSNHSALDGYLLNIDNPELEAEWLASDKEMQSLMAAVASIDRLLSRDHFSRLAMLSTIFQLDEEEKDILQACIAVGIEPTLGAVFAFLNDHSGRNYVTASLVTRLFGHSRFQPLTPSSPLIIWGFIKQVEIGVGEPKQWQCDPFILNWVIGVAEIDERLAAIAVLHEGYPPLPHWPVNETVSAVKKRMQQEKNICIRCIINAPENSGRKNFADAVARKLGVRMLIINSDKIPEEQWLDIYMHAQRQAFLDRYAIFWKGQSILQRNWRTDIPSFTLQFLSDPGGHHLPANEAFTDLHIELPPLPVQSSIALWHQWIPASTAWDKHELEQMIMRHKPVIGLIARAGKAGVSSVQEAADSLREYSRHQLGSLAQLVNGSFNWDDLIVPDWLRSNLIDLSFEATDREKLWKLEETKRLFPQGRGLIALFTGPPGTGKTMAAQVIANTLRLDLFRVDLSSIVSKYIGETSKNIEQIFSRARVMNAVLLFDEADALFGKRTDIKDAHDRYANTDTNYLLQAIEDYPGIVILASNKKGNIDGGFLRRLRYVLDFPKPEAMQRYQLWKQLVTELTGTDAASKFDGDLKQLSEMVEVTGAQIKMSILSALFISRKENIAITIHHILNGLSRELAKEGRSLGKQVTETFKHYLK